MGIFLGNLSISELIQRTGYNISDEDRKILEQHRQDNATIDPCSDKFHIFDIPFSIQVTEAFKDKLIEILIKYEEISKSKETLAITIVKESDQEKEKRLKKEKEQKEWRDKLANPNSIWNVKWHMLVPVTIVDTETKRESECYYKCFINTYTTGRDNIPDIIEGKAFIKMDEEGFNGRFTLYNPEKDNDADEHDDWDWVIGSGFYSKSGNHIGNVDDAYFEETEFSIAECIQNLVNTDRSSKEIHFSKIKE